MSNDAYANEDATQELLRISKWPEPLRLAYLLEKELQWPLHSKAADELRRLHAIEAKLAEQPAHGCDHCEQQCRTDGRCQYAIDSGAEGMGHCPPGKCCMPAQQEPVFCEHCGGNDEDPQDHCMDCTRPRWEAVTQELLNNQHPWLYEPMWIATKGGTVLQGHYEWRQGRNPDRFITDDGDEWAFDFAYVMPIVKPTHPDKEKP